MKFTLSHFDSPLGELSVVTDDKGLLSVLMFSDHHVQLHRVLREHYGDFDLEDGAAPAHITDALQRYFEGEPSAVDGIVTMTGGTDFQRQVWAALRWIPAGQTTSYGELARSLGYDDPRMAIDVGAANAANPIAIVVPCHRVVAKNGDIKGYAWGVQRKRWLLEHEQTQPQTQSPKPQETLRLPGF
jgi:methylated-DNA-[protein]-cysteine S-methyltransferase